MIPITLNKPQNVTQKSIFYGPKHRCKVSIGLRMIAIILSDKWTRTQEMEAENNNLILQRHMYMLASYEMLYST